MNPIDQLLNLLRPKSYRVLQDECNITLTREQFEAKMLQEPMGLEYLRVLQAYRPAFMWTYYKGGTWYCRIESWLELQNELGRFYNLLKGKCVEKTQRGNSYEDRHSAALSAARMSKETKQCIVEFQCVLCGKWHIGKQRRPSGS